MPTARAAIQDRVVFWGAVLVICTGFFLAYIPSLPWQEPRLSLTDLMAGTAHRPFVHRVFVPAVVRLAMMVAPLPAEVYAAGLIYLFFVGFVLSMERLARHFWPLPIIPQVVALAALPALGPLTLTHKHVYDIGTLFFFTLSLEEMAQRRWGRFLLAFTLSCLNKETALLLTLIFGACFWTVLDRARFWRLTLLQLGIYLALRAVLIWVFRDNPGGEVEYRLGDQLASIINSPAATAAQWVFGLFVLRLISWRWAAKPAFLRRAAWAVTPPLLVLYGLFGYPFEIRVFYEAFPILFLLSAPTLGRYSGLDFFAAPPA